MTGMSFNPTLHGLRGIAALMVLVFHWEQFYPALTNSVSRVSLLGTSWDLAMQVSFGWLGVHLFFVLSGYLLAGQLAHRELAGAVVGKFYFRRVMRIYPAVWLQLVILLAMATLLTGFYQWPTTSNMLANALLWLNIPGSMFSPLNGVWWTLPIELGFYLVLPLLVLIARRIGWWPTFLLGALMTLGWRWSVFDDFAGENYLVILPLLDFLPGSLNSFLVGALVSQLRPAAGRREATWALASGLVLLVSLQYWQISLADVYWHGHWILVVWVPMVAVAIGLILYGLLPAEGQYALLRNRSLVWLGDVSFGIYLWHFPVLQLIRWWQPEFGQSPAESLLILPLLLVGTLVLAWLSYRLIERPAMQFRR